MQMPPSESLRAIAIMVEALDQAGLNPDATLIVLRGIQTVTVIVRPAGWSHEKLVAIRAFAQNRKFDLVWLPDINESEINQFNRLPEPSLYLALDELFFTPDRAGFYQNYAYNISPSTDNRPFFFHFFTWKQTPEVLASLGHIWQPFGGSGYFVLLALLLLTIILSIGLILFPLIGQRRHPGELLLQRWSVLVYFSFLGVAFLFIEIPLIQHWILILGHPTLAFTTVVASLLCFSGLGSSVARATWLPQRAAFVGLLVWILIMAFTIPQFSSFLLSLPFWVRLLMSVLSLAPLGIMMGLPFPLGIAWLEVHAQSWIPLAWAVNGCLSVIASVLAAILSLSYGFSIVLLLGLGAYGGASILYLRFTGD
jgi:hypothetical protein